MCWWPGTNHYLVSKGYSKKITELRTCSKSTVNAARSCKWNDTDVVCLITFNLSNKDSHLWNDMIAVLSANFAQVSGTQTDFWCKLNYQIEPKANKRKCEAKQHKVMPKMQQTRSNRQNGAWLAQRRTNWAKNTTSVSSYDLEQVTPTKYPNQN